MRTKYISIVLVIILIVAIPVAARFFNFGEPDYQSVITDASIEAPIPDEPVIEPVLIAERGIDDITREEFLYDFDYLVYVLETNFPSFGIVYRRHGVDMMSLAEELRKELTDESRDMDIERFIELIRVDFLGQARQIGHLRLVLYPEWRQIISIDELNYDFFYYNFQYHPYLRDLSTFRLDVFRSAVSEKRYTHSRHLLDIRPMSDLDEVRAIEVDTIEDGRIAYINVRSLPNRISINPLDLETLTYFLSSIGGYQHLIIDIREAPGGYRGFFDIIAKPLIRMPLTGRRDYFFMNGTRNMEFMQTVLDSGMKRTFNISDLRTIIAPRITFPEYVLDDLMYMNYHFRMPHVMHPLPREERSPFQGKIWMLISESNASAAQIVADFYKYSGFATLVGETTRGMMPPPWSSAYFSLPNTGLIIRYDPAYVINPRSSRPLEEGTEPHYFNRRGLDALETVLEMIREADD